MCCTPLFYYVVSCALHMCATHATPVRISRCLFTIHTCAVYFLPFFIDSFTCSNTTRCCIIRNLMLLLWCTPKQCDLQIRTTHMIYTCYKRTHKHACNHTAPHDITAHNTTLHHTATLRRALFSAPHTAHAHTNTRTRVSHSRVPSWERAPVCLNC